MADVSGLPARGKGGGGVVVGWGDALLVALGGTGSPARGKFDISVAVG